MNKDVKSVLAINLKNLMRHKYGKIHQSKLRDDSGVAHATIGRLIRAEVAPNTETLDCIAKAFDVNPWMLLVPDLDVVDLPHLAHPAGVGLDRVTSIYKALDDEGRAFMDNAANVSWVMLQGRQKKRKLG